MTKYDLKNGMVVEIRRGDRYLVLDDKVIRDKGWLYKDVFNVDLTDRDNNKTFDVIKVFDVIFDLNDVKTTTSLIWERKEPTTYKVEEVFK